MQGAAQELHGPSGPDRRPGARTPAGQRLCGAEWQVPIRAQLPRRAFPLQPHLSRRDVVTTPREGGPFCKAFAAIARICWAGARPRARRDRDKWTATSRIDHMMLWAIFCVLMSAAAVFAVLHGPWRASRAPIDAGSDLGRVSGPAWRRSGDRDRSAGLIGEEEAEAARIEISRRMLAAAGLLATRIHAFAATLWHRRMAAIAVLGVLLFLPLGLYAVLGSAGECSRTGRPLLAGPLAAGVTNRSRHSLAGWRST